MNSKNVIQDELKDLGSSLNRELAMPVFDLPESYFENFAASVLARIKGENEPAAFTEIKELSSTLSAIPRNMPFSVPENYFSNLTNDLASLTKEDDVPEALMVADKAMPYAVPAGYFENLPAQILGKVSKPKTKIISLGSHRFRNLAAAAMVAGLMAVSGIVYFSSQSGKSIDPAKHPNDWVAAKLKNVSNQELEEFINTADAVAGKKDIAKNMTSAREVRQMLSDVPDKELDAFLNAVSADGTAATN